ASLRVAGEFYLHKMRLLLADPEVGESMGTLLQAENLPSWNSLKEVVENADDYYTALGRGDQQAAADLAWRRGAEFVRRIQERVLAANDRKPVLFLLQHDGGTDAAANAEALALEVRPGEA
ncbi:unnamed protein product, partial [Amoebophrya sp. A120]